MYKAIQIFLMIFFRIFFRLKIYGLAHIPQEGKLIIAANHMSNLDPLVVGTALPRPIHFMAKQELFENLFMRKIILFLGTFPVRRGLADRQAIHTALQLLKEGEVLGLFPEGTRSKTGELGKAQAGVALLAFKSKSPVIPTLLVGTNQVMQLSAIQIYFGPPLYPPDEKAGKEELEKFSQQIMDEIAKLKLKN